MRVISLGFCLSYSISTVENTRWFQSVASHSLRRKLIQIPVKCLVCTYLGDYSCSTDLPTPIIQPGTDHH